MLEARIAFHRFFRAVVPDKNNGEDIIAFIDNHVRSIVVPEDCIRYADAIILNRMKQTAH